MQINVFATRVATPGALYVYAGLGLGPFLGVISGWSAGLKVNVDKYFMDFRYWDTSIDTPAALSQYGRLADSRFLFTAGVTLP